MSMHVIALTLLGVWLLPLTGFAEPEKKPGQPTAEARWESMLAWLPEDTETVIVSQRPYRVPKWKPARAGALPGPWDFAATLRDVPLGPFFGLVAGTPQDMLTGQTVRCAVEGSRRFRGPGTSHGLGAYRYEGCHILLFEDATEETLGKVFEKCLAAAAKKIKLADSDIAVFPVTEYGLKGLWTYYLAHPRPGVILCATDEKYLEESLKRIARPGGKRALPVDLPEWKQVDVKASVWAVRHYRKELADQDQTSPLKSGVAFGPDAEAIGFVFWYSGGKVAHARYLSGSNEATEVVKKGFAQAGANLKVAVKRGGPGVAEISAEVEEQESGSLVLLLVLSGLGHAINL